MKAILFKLLVAALAMIGGGLALPAQAAKMPPKIAFSPARSCRQVRERLTEVVVERQLRRYRYWAPYSRRHRYHYRPHRRRRIDALADRIGRIGRRGLRAAPRQVTRAAAGRGRSTGSTAETAGSSGWSRPSSAADGPSHFTKTNIQERGVDEADLVKTDGKRIFAAVGDELLVLKSWPPKQSAILSRHRLGGQVQKLLLRGPQLVAFSRSSRGSRATTRITLLDVERPENARVVKQHEIQGRLHQALMIEDDVYIISSTALQLPSRLWRFPISRDQWPARDGRTMSSRQWRQTKRWLAKTLRASARAKINAAGWGRILPRKYRLDSRGRVVGSAPLCRCGDLYLPPEGIHAGLLTVTRLDLAAAGQSDSLAATALATNATRFYASTDNLYVASTKSWRTTQLHKLVLQSELGRPEYVAAGEIDGRLLNQFSMSEHQGHLRIATTGSDGNNLFVLREEGGRLKTVGAVRGLARGERIYAARMFGDKGYIVTFRQTDPLYTLDLSNPHRPRVIGELKVNGFSSYIHPLGKNHLLTIGQDATSSGRVLGMHLQIFDVSDFAKPRRTHHYRFSKQHYARSIAQQNHHAFTYDPRTRVLAIPLAYQQYRPYGGFSGLLLLRVGRKKGFEELGRISHDRFELQRLLARHGCADHQQTENRGVSNCPYYRARYRRRASLSTPIQRSIVMDRFIYTLSNQGLMIHGLQSKQIVQPLRTLSFSKS